MTSVEMNERGSGQCGSVEWGQACHHPLGPGKGEVVLEYAQRGDTTAAEPSRNDAGDVSETRVGGCAEVNTLDNGRNNGVGDGVGIVQVGDGVDGHRVGAVKSPRMSRDWTDNVVVLVLMAGVVS